MADSVFERHLQNVTNRIKKRKYEDLEYHKPKTAKINVEDDLKILDRDLLVTDDDFTCFSDEHKRDELVFDESQNGTIDEWNDTSKSQDGSPVSTKVVKLGCDLDNKTPTKSPVPNKVIKLGHKNDLGDKFTNSSTSTENDKPVKVDEKVPKSDMKQTDLKHSNHISSKEDSKDTYSSKKRGQAEQSLLNTPKNAKNVLKSDMSPSTKNEKENVSKSTSVNNTSITSLKRKRESIADLSTDGDDSVPSVMSKSHISKEIISKKETQTDNEQKPLKCSENVAPVVPLTKVESKSDQVILNILQKDEESSSDTSAKRNRAALTEKGLENRPQSPALQMEKTSAISVLKGWPEGVEINDLLVLVMSGDKKIRTVQKVTPSLRDPQLFVRVTSCVSSGPLKVIVIGLQRCVNLNRKFFKVSAIGQTEIEKGKKTDRIMLSEATGTDSSIISLFSTDNFPNIKHAATNHIPESNYEVYIQNLIGTHLEYKSRYILLQNTKTGVIYLFMEDYQSRIDDKFLFPFPLRPCTPYKIMIWLADHHADKTLQAFCKIKDSSDEGYSQSDNIQFITAVKNLQTYVTKLELRKLADLATAYVVSGSYNQYAYLHCFYRNKPESYFQAIYNRDNGIMLPYMKDQNGDPSSVINGNIKGLFFSSVLDRHTLEPMSFSFFGSRRIYILSQLMFHDDSNIYFADFYCHYDVHYVTVVLTEPGSATDQFCRERLLLLNKYNNPFIKLVNINGESKVYVTLGVHVEVFYTEPIDLYFVFNRQMGFLFEDTPTRGRGCSIPKVGIPKRSDCKICNL